MRLVIAEKPSVARDLARVLGATHRGDGYLEGPGLLISWCIGHLLELDDPKVYNPTWSTWRLETLPMVPDSFSLRVRKGAEDQWKVLHQLMRRKDVTSVVNACDAGREGELIFRYAMQHADVALPVERFWASSLTDEAIRQAWDRLRPGADFDALADAARCRSESDWLVGLNLTRALTCRTRDEGGDALWSVGRVQTPTLALIVARDAEIAAFVPETYWTVKATMVAAPGEWTATFQSEPGGSEERRDGEASSVQRLHAVEEADGVASASDGAEGRVVHAKRKTRVEKPPLLYDLTSLQRRANQRYGLPAARTLEVAQALYETHKLLTYPRTDARYLTSDQVSGLPDVVAGVGHLEVYANITSSLLATPLRVGSRIVNDAEVGDHHAIIPTGRAVQAGRLSPDERRIYDLVTRRFLAALSPDAEIDLAELHVEASPVSSLPDRLNPPLLYVARGRVVRVEGWRSVDPPRARKDVTLPHVEVGEPVRLREPVVKEAQTRPPRAYDDASLLKAMETAGRQLDDAALKRAMRKSGLGTPATRAAILQTLLKRKYIARDKRSLLSTATGRALVEALPVDELKSAELTGRWEHRLADLAEGRGSRQAFMKDVVANLHGLVEAVASAPMPASVLVRTRPLGKTLGECPACGTPVRSRGPVFACETGRSCPFVVFGTMSGRTISARMVSTLLRDGRTDIVKGFKSKKGKPFEAGLEVRSDHTVGFYFPPRTDARSAPSSEAPQSRTSPAAGPVGRTCPSCGVGVVMEGRTAWGCSRWKEGCGWRLPFTDQGVRRTDSIAVALIERDAAERQDRR